MSERKSSKNGNKALQGLLGFIVIVGVVLGLTAFILHFTDKKKCSEGFVESLGDLGDSCTKGSDCGSGVCGDGNCVCNNGKNGCNLPEGGYCKTWGQQQGGNQCQSRQCINNQCTACAAEGDSCSTTGPVCQNDSSWCCPGNNMRWVCESGTEGQEDCDRAQCCPENKPRDAITGECHTPY